MGTEDALTESPVLPRTSVEALEAVRFCEKEINEYRDWFRWNEHRWVLYQHSAIIMGVLATVFSALSIDAKSDWGVTLLWARVITAACATISAGFIGSFHYREDAVRHEMTGN